MRRVAAVVSALALSVGAVVALGGSAAVGGPRSGDGSTGATTGSDVGAAALPGARATSVALSDYSDCTSPAGLDIGLDSGPAVDREAGSVTNEAGDTLMSFDQSSGLANFSGVLSGYNFASPAWNQPTGSLIGLYAWVGQSSAGPDSPPDPATSAEWFVLYTCNDGAPGTGVLASCFGDIGTCPTTVQEALGDATRVVFDEIGSTDWVVPADVCTVTVDVSGAQGGAAADDGVSHAAPGGLGGHVQGTLTVTPGQLLQVNVGGVGGQGSIAPSEGTAPGGAGGFNGDGDGGAAHDGGRSGGGGGGASDVRTGNGGTGCAPCPAPPPLDDLSANAPDPRMLVGGGGGGAGGWSGFGDTLNLGYPGGAGGGASGGDPNGDGADGGFAPGNLQQGGFGGQAGVAGGAGGDGSLDSDGAAGTSGDASTGGTGGTNANREALADDGGGGGGGGGFVGGGGGGGVAGSQTGTGGAGGGGSNSVTPGATEVSSEAGTNAGDGLVVVSYRTTVIGGCTQPIAAIVLTPRFTG